MTCDDARTLMHGALDRELDLAASLAVESHLRACPACARLFHDHQAIRRLLRAEPRPFNAPPALRSRVRTAVRAAGGRRWPGRRWAVAAAAALLVGLGWGVAHLAPGPSHEDRVAQEVVAGHLRSLQAAGHRTDVASDDRHTVKPWFAGRLAFAPPVPDLGRHGFPLEGGRLDYLDGQPVAALVYGHGRHTINLFCWPAADGAEAPPVLVTRQTYHLLHWARGGLQFWAVADVQPATLEEFARLVQAWDPAAGR